MYLLNNNMGIIIGASIAAFLIIILVLVAILLIARKKLTPQGEVKIKINNDNEVETNPGSGTCGMCKVKVNEGGGSILPTEKGFFSRKEQQNNWRLGCQVKVRNDLDIEVPAEIFGIKKWECEVKKWECEVVSNNNVATFIKEFVVKLPEGETLDFRSGGYIQIDIPATEVDYKDIEIGEEYRAE